MATYTVDKISYGGNTYNLQDAGALQLTGGSVTGPVTFGDSVSIDDLSTGTLSVTGGATFANNIQANKINNVTVGSSPKFTDTITTVSTSGSGNAITSITASNGAITATKGSTFLTSSDISGKIDTAGTGLSKSGTTLNHSNSVTAQTTQAVYPIKIDAQGHISAYGSAVTIPSDVNVTSTAVTAATTNYITGSTTSTTTTGTLSKHASAVMYTTADSGTSGYTQLRLGNATATSSAGGKEGQIRLYGTNATYYLDLKPGAIASSNKTITFPNATGTVALTSDIPTVPTITLNGSSTTSPSFYAPTGAGTSGQYLKSSGTGAPTWTNFPTIPSITLNGSSTTSPSFYAPTGAGTSGQYLKSNGSGAPSWTNFPTIPGAGTTASAVGTTASGGSASTYSKSDHVHNITGTTITTALGYTPSVVQIVRW